MTTEQTISWIFLAIASASQMAPTTFQGISMIADGINHAVPTHKELQTSVSWLMHKDMIKKIGKKYQLIEKGRNIYNETSKNSTTLFQIWEQLELKIAEFA